MGGGCDGGRGLCSAVLTAQCHECRSRVLCTQPGALLSRRCLQAARRRQRSLCRRRLAVSTALGRRSICGSRLSICSAGSSLDRCELDSSPAAGILMQPRLVQLDAAKGLRDAVALDRDVLDAALGHHHLSQVDGAPGTQVDIHPVVVAPVVAGGWLRAAADAPHCVQADSHDQSLSAQKRRAGRTAAGVLAELGDARIELLPFAFVILE